MELAGGPNHARFCWAAGALAFLVIGLLAVPVRAWIWLLEQYPSPANFEITAWQAWHGRLMVLGWGIAVPVGIVAARFYKVTPRQDWPRQLDAKVWWYAHLTLLGSAIFIATIGLAVAWSHSHTGFARLPAHALLGWLTMFLGWLQIAGGLLRGTKGGPSRDGMSSGDHFDMTLRRRIFERLHKSGGYVAIAASIVTIILGLRMVYAPRWMWLMLALWWLFLASVFISLQIRGRCIDTYQAIWGLDPSLPGNRMRPIGWGVRRLSLLDGSKGSVRK